MQQNFSDKVRQFRHADKERFLDFYLNNVGIRKSVKLLGCSPSLLVRWVKELASNLGRDLSKVQAGLASHSLPEVIEMDEIYTRVKKGVMGSVMGFLFSATRQSCTHTIGPSSTCAIELYNLTKRAVFNISFIYTDGNSSYIERFSDICISALHIVAPDKSETHMIESGNSSI